MPHSKELEADYMQLRPELRRTEDPSKEIRNADHIQDAFVSAYRQRNTIHSNPHAYFRKAFRNMKCRNRPRKRPNRLDDLPAEPCPRKRRPTAGPLRAPPGQRLGAIPCVKTRTPSSLTVQREHIAAITEAKESLDAVATQIVDLHLKKSMTFAQIAKLTCQTVNAVSAKYYLAIRKMKEHPTVRRLMK